MMAADSLARHARRKAVRSIIRFWLVAAGGFPALCSAAEVGGVLSSNTVWSGAIDVVSSVTVAGSVTLTIEAGAAVRLTNDASISVQAGGALVAQGTAGNPVTFMPLNPGANWGTLNASGAAASITVRQAELAHGGINLASQATGLIENCYVHDVSSAIVGNSARSVTMRRVHVKNYSETIFNSGTMVLAEDSLYENMTAANSDALEIQGGLPGSIIRRCTFRHSSGSNSDAIDFNGTSGVLVQDCLIYDFSDKGVSLGASGAGGTPDYGIVVSNCLIYAVDTGIAIKDGTTCGLFGNTIADCAYGWRLYQKFTTPVDGGHVTNACGNILWGNVTTINLADNSSVVATYNDFQGTNWPGDGNLNIDPLFVNAAQNDYRLAAGSPGLGAGKSSSDMGAQFPVGAPMAQSHPQFQSVSYGTGEISLRFWADPEKTYTVQYRDSIGAGAWLNLANAPSPTLPGLVEVKDGLQLPAGINDRFYRLVTPALP